VGFDFIGDCVAKDFWVQKVIDQIKAGIDGWG
jgi:hypothetical protein